MPLKIAVLLSGSGTTLQNLIDRAGAGELDAQFGLNIAGRLFDALESTPAT